VRVRPRETHGANEGATRLPRKDKDWVVETAVRDRLSWINGWEPEDGAGCGINSRVFHCSCFSFGDDTLSVDRLSDSAYVDTS